MISLSTNSRFTQEHILDANSSQNYLKAIISKNFNKVLEK